MTLSVLMHKELLEQVRTRKLLVVACAFLLFGLISPLTAKMIPELIKLAGEGMVIQLPDPNALFALDQYLKNTSQMGLIVVVLMALGSIAGERERGTAAMILCKPVSRSSFVASKFLVHALVLGGALALAALACYYYVAIIWEPFDAVAFAASNALLGVYLLSALALALLASALFRSTLAAGGAAAAMLVALSLAQAVPPVGGYAPGALLSWSRSVTAGIGEGAWPALLVTLGIILACGMLAWAAIKNREL